ncbi:sigma-54 interaction domain-containing protein [bacterium]
MPVSARILEKTLKTNKEIIDFPLNIVNKDGKTIPISISTGVLKDKNSDVVGGVETFRDLSVIEELKKEIHQKYTFEDIVSKNHEIQKIFNILPDVAESDSTVLIEGPSGSGKELFARAIHTLSEMNENPYVVVSCGSLPDNLLESELFGYEKGAFTDAKKDKPGRFALAEGGTVFLDEIGDISPAFQVKLLRVLQEKEYEPLGATQTVKANVRVVAATNRNLMEMVNNGDFRRDLYYRLNVVRIELPSLAKRREDIPLLVDHFVNRFNLKKGKNITGISDEVMSLLMRHSFPGNVRELENIIEHAFVLCRTARIGLEHIPHEILDTDVQIPRIEPGSDSRINESEKRVIIEALSENEGNRSKTAEALGMSKVTLWRKMKKFGIEI